MRYNVAQLLKEPVGGVRRYTLHEEIDKLDENITPLTALDGALQMLRTPEGILVTGDLHATVEVACSRCLELFAMPVRFTIEEEFSPTIDIITGARIPQPEDADPATRIDAKHTLDLTEVLRQNMLLEMPVAAVCRSKCAGLCPHCGKNWNQGPCDCTPEDLDPRLAVLKQLLE